MKIFRFILILFVLAACSMPTAQTGQDDTAISTAAAMTVQAVLSAATPLSTQVATATQPPVPAVCEDSAQNTAWNRDGVLYDVNAVNKPLAPKTSFVMSWTFKNTGTCTWDSTYLMYFESGTALTTSPGYPIVKNGQTVAPGESVIVDIEMTSPDKAGDYASSWRLQSNRGAALMNFGVLLKVGNAASKAPKRPSTVKYEYDCTSGVVKIKLTWLDDATDEDGYRVYRDGNLLENLPLDSTAYEDIAPGVGTFIYTVTAFNTAGESSAEISVTTSNCQ